MDVAAAVDAVLGSGGDETVLEYVKGVLGDEEFEWAGEDGESAYDAVGPFLVRRCCDFTLELVSTAVVAQRRVGIEQDAAPCTWT